MSKPVHYPARIVDKDSHDELYRDRVSDFANLRSKDAYKAMYKKLRLSPFYAGGHTKGYVRGETVKLLLRRARETNLPFHKITVLDAGCGRGELSVYLACHGFRVIGVDVSEVACVVATQLAENLGVEHSCIFLAENLEQLSIADCSVDFIIGHASLHHFIKYKGVPRESLRITKAGAEGYFADAFGANRVYHLFHDKARMARFGDVPLTESTIRTYFSEFKVELIPTDWFTMLDKLYLRIFPDNFKGIIRRLSRIHFWLDRKVPTNAFSLFLSGSVMTIIKKRRSSQLAKIGVNIST